MLTNEILSIILISIIVSIQIILIIVLLIKNNKLNKRLNKFLTGKDGISLEKNIISLCEDNKFIKIDTEKNKKDIIINRITRSVNYQSHTFFVYACRS